MTFAHKSVTASQNADSLIVKEALNNAEHRTSNKGLELTTQYSCFRVFRGHFNPER
jgi:hypothetical protein